MSLRAWKMKSLLTLVVVFFFLKGAFEKSNSLIKFMQNMSSVNMNSTDRLWKSA